MSYMDLGALESDLDGYLEACAPDASADAGATCVVPTGDGGVDANADGG